MNNEINAITGKEKYFARLIFNYFHFFKYHVALFECSPSRAGAIIIVKIETNRRSKWRKTTENFVGLGQRIAHFMTATT